MKTVYKAGLLLFIYVLAPTPDKRVKMESIDSIKQETARNNDTLYVVNFWATWCAPCVKELPVFQRAYKLYASQKVKMIYVCLNAPKELAQVEKFANDKDLKPEVILISDQNPNAWINKIDTSWSGTIPATVLYKHGVKQYFYEGECSPLKLDSLIATNLQ
ncbi:MAG TPA: TlpA family protein disulfide reductase [Bacteroidia bacterium]|jgi:thiol-disulfide isomerase/thioredoxin|nr:TlpA family protein disulfide reductase [Bacteroidia bacterium]